jgi:hypothetical protein
LVAGLTIAFAIVCRNNMPPILREMKHSESLNHLLQSRQIERRHFLDWNIHKYL